MYIILKQYFGLYLNYRVSQKDYPSIQQIIMDIILNSIKSNHTTPVDSIEVSILCPRNSIFITVTYPQFYHQYHKNV